MSVFILVDHHHGNTTYVVGDLIKNGCTTFHISEIDEVVGE